MKSEYAANRALHPTTWYRCPTCEHVFDVAAEKPPCPRCGARCGFLDRIPDPQPVNERRTCVRSQIDYYEHQARLAERGDTQRRSADFFRRQVQYLRTQQVR